MWKESLKKRPRAERTPFPLAFRDLGGEFRQRMATLDGQHPRSTPSWPFLSGDPTICDMV